MLLRRADKPDIGAVLIPKLQRGGRIETTVGRISHDSVIGTKLRDVVNDKKSKKGKRGVLRALRPSLAEYVTLSPRIVTPVRL